MERTLGIVWLGVFGTVIGSARGQADLTPILRPIAARHWAVPGMVAAIVENDRVSAIGAVGVRKAGTKVAFTDADQIHLGSDTKAMTAVLIGQLIDQKKLSFDSKVGEIFPDLAGKMNPAAAKVTILQLMHHRAGLPHDLDWDAIDASGKSMMEQRQMALQQAFAKKPEFEPGSQFAYSNVGYVILGAVVENIVGRPWEEVIRERLFEPLGMKSAGFGPPGALGKIDEPWGHTSPLGVPAPIQSDNQPVIGPAGRVHCSITDWGKFVSLFLDAAAGKPRLISAKMFSELTDPGTVGDYAGGWGIAHARLGRRNGADSRGIKRDVVLRGVGCAQARICGAGGGEYRRRRCLRGLRPGGQRDDRVAREADRAELARLQLHGPQGHQITSGRLASTVIPGMDVG